MADLLLSWTSPSRHALWHCVNVLCTPNRQRRPCLSDSVCTVQSIKGPSFDDVGDNDIRLH